jgi:BlaI family transcriptional regulator, penicillinase repressor
MKTLTKAEEQIMHIIWELDRVLVRDILEQLPEPKPAYNTVSTVVRVLEKKGFVDHKSYGTTYEYYPQVSKEEYTRFHFREFLSKYFDNSFPQMASFFATENNIGIEDLEEMLREIEMEMDKKESRS